VSDAICNVAWMRIGVIGGSGPAGTALAARLASVGYEVVIGSRSKYRAMETRDEIVSRHPELESLLGYGENDVAADCDLVVIATPWDSAATMAQALAPRLVGKIVVSMANALVRVGSEFEPLIPPRGSVAAHVQAAAPKSRVALDGCPRKTATSAAPSRHQEIHHLSSTSWKSVRASSYSSRAAAGSPSFRQTSARPTVILATPRGSPNSFMISRASRNCLRAVA